MLPETGDSYGYNAPIGFIVPQDTQSGAFFSLFYDDGPGVPYNGNSNQGGSGSWVFNPSGQLIGAAVAATGTPSDISRSTVVANFTDPGFYNQIAPYVGIQVVPAKGAKITSVTTDASDVLVSFRGSGSSNYFVRATSFLGGTNSNFLDISPSISPTQSGITVSTFRDVGALTNSAARFYRIRVQ